MDIMSLLMAQRAGGNTPSGGGSVNSVNGVKPDGAGNVTLAYNDLTGKPFSKGMGEVRYLEDKVIASEYDSEFGAYCVYCGFYLSSMPLDGTCTVKWDGVTRNHAIIEANVMGEVYHGFGNLAMFAAFGITAPNTGEPYAFLVYPSGFAQAFTMDTTAQNHTVSVSANATVYNPMEQGCLDIPTVDFTKLGMSAIPQGESVEIKGDFSELCKMLRTYNFVKVRYVVALSQGAIDCVGVVPVAQSFDLADIWLYSTSYYGARFLISKSRISGRQLSTY